jgi:exocyst complex component 2
MYEVLTTLVGIHAQICSVAEPILDRTVNKLVEQLAEEGLKCFRQIKRFGMGGMLRVCLVIQTSLRSSNLTGCITCAHRRHSR